MTDETAEKREELPPLRDVIARHGLAARKGLGQHFLLDLNLTRRIARNAGIDTGDEVVEIGPGPGGLTRALLETPCRRVTAIERDSRCIEALAPLGAVYGERFRLIEGDALTIDETALCTGPVRIVANLPYNIATALLVNWLKRIDRIASMTLMFQREVAERIAARPRSKAYGRLSVMSQWLCEADILFDIAPRAFTPPPRVVSSVIGLYPRADPEPAPFDTMEEVVAAAFSQRRKMLRKSLKTLGADTGALLDRAGIAGTRRAEELETGDFCALARSLAAMRSR